jgi:hypothetical protein
VGDANEGWPQSSPASAIVALVPAQRFDRKPRVPQVNLGHGDRRPGQRLGRAVIDAQRTGVMVNGILTYLRWSWTRAHRTRTPMRTRPAMATPCSEYQWSKP